MCRGTTERLWFDKQNKSDDVVEMQTKFYDLRFFVKNLFEKHLTSETEYAIIMQCFERGVRKMQTKGTKQICDNRQARHEYFILERYEAGISLQGNEVKSIRQGHINLKDAWCDITNGELFLKGMHISPYEKDGLFRTDPMRIRKLLMHSREIDRLFGKVKQDGLTLIPLSLYFKNSRVKVEVGLCKGKKLYDKRQAAANRDAQRQIRRAVKEKNAR